MDHRGLHRSSRNNRKKIKRDRTRNNNYYHVENEKTPNFSHKNSRVKSRNRNSQYHQNQELNLQQHRQEREEVEETARALLDLSHSKETTRKRRRRGSGELRKARRRLEKRRLTLSQCSTSIASSQQEQEHVCNVPEIEILKETSTSRKYRKHKKNGKKKIAHDGSEADDESGSNYEEEEDLEIPYPPADDENNKTKDNSIDMADYELEIPYFQSLSFPGSSQMVLGLSAQTRKQEEPLRAGDIIQYTNPVFVAGSEQGLRQTQILAVKLPLNNRNDDECCDDYNDDDHHEFLLELANGERLPSSTRIKRVQEFVQETKRLYKHRGIYRPMHNFRLVPGSLPRPQGQSYFTGMDRQIQNIQSILDDGDRQCDEIVKSVFHKKDGQDGDSVETYSDIETLKPAIVPQGRKKEVENFEMGNSDLECSALSNFHTQRADLFEEACSVAKRPQDEQIGEERIHNGDNESSSVDFIEVKKSQSRVAFRDGSRGLGGNSSCSVNKHIFFAAGSDDSTSDDDNLLQDPFISGDRKAKSGASDKGQKSCITSNKENQVDSQDPDYKITRHKLSFGKFKQQYTARGNGYRTTIESAHESGSRGTQQRDGHEDSPQLSNRRRKKTPIRSQKPSCIDLTHSCSDCSSISETEKPKSRNNRKDKKVNSAIRKGRMKQIRDQLAIMTNKRQSGDVFDFRDSQDDAVPSAVGASSIACDNTGRRRTPIRVRDVTKDRTSTSKDTTRRSSSNDKTKKSSRLAVLQVAKHSSPMAPVVACNTTTSHKSPRLRSAEKKTTRSNNDTMFDAMTDSPSLLHIGDDATSHAEEPEALQNSAVKGEEVDLISSMGTPNSSGFDTSGTEKEGHISTSELKVVSTISPQKNLPQRQRKEALSSQKSRSQHPPSDRDQSSSSSSSSSSSEDESDDGEVRFNEVMRRRQRAKNVLPPRTQSNKRFTLTRHKEAPLKPTTISYTALISHGAANAIVGRKVHATVSKGLNNPGNPMLQPQPETTKGDKHYGVSFKGKNSASLPTYKLPASHIQRDYADDVDETDEDDSNWGRVLKRASVQNQKSSNAWSLESEPICSTQSTQNGFIQHQEGQNDVRTLSTSRGKNAEGDLSLTIEEDSDSGCDEGPFASHLSICAGFPTPASRCSSGHGDDSSIFQSDALSATRKNAMSTGTKSYNYRSKGRMSSGKYGPSNSGRLSFTKVSKGCRI